MVINLLILSTFQFQTTISPLVDIICMHVRECPLRVCNLYIWCESVLTMLMTVAYAYFKNFTCVKAFNFFLIISSTMAVLATIDPCNFHSISHRLAYKQESVLSFSLY